MTFWVKALFWQESKHKEGRKEEWDLIIVPKRLNQTDGMNLKHFIVLPSLCFHYFRKIPWVTHHHMQQATLFQVNLSRIFKILWERLVVVVVVVVGCSRNNNSNGTNTFRINWCTYKGRQWLLFTWGYKVKHIDIP